MGLSDRVGLRLSHAITRDARSYHKLCHYTTLLGDVLASYGSGLIPSVCHVEEKSKFLLVEDGTLATFPGTFEEHEEEIRSDIKTEVVPMKLLVLFLSRFMSCS